MFLCPQLESSCCSIYDQFAMYKNWHSTIKKKLQKHFYAIGKKLKSLSDIFERSLLIDFDELLEKLHASDNVKNKLY